VNALSPGDPDCAGTEPDDRGVGQAPPRQDREMVQYDRKPPTTMTDQIKKAASDFLLKPLKLKPLKLQTN
jgi:hypothetical protein